MKGLTKREIRITDPDQIARILDTAKVLHLGLAVKDEPYVVPMNYGYTMEEGKLTLYLHSAVKGIFSLGNSHISFSFFVKWDYYWPYLIRVLHKN